MGAWQRRTLAGAGLLASIAVAAPAEAQVCAARKISATGATAQFAVLGKVAARTAWSSKVSADPRLGSTYGTWLRGKERRIICRKVDNRHLCLAVALPCRSASRLATPQQTAPAAANPKQRPL